MTQQIELAASSARLRPPTYDELYGRPDRAARGSRTPPRRSRLWTGLATGSAIVVMAGSWSQRERVVRVVPGLAGAFAAVGKPVNLRGLAFNDVRASLLDDGGSTVLAVEGRVANLRDRTLELPDLRVSVNAPNGQEIYSWVAAAPKAALTAGEDIYFRARLSSPPGEGERVMVRFADAAPKAKR